MLNNIIQQLEQANPYDYERGKEPRYVAWNRCIMKLRELLSSQKIINDLAGEPIQETQTVTTPEGLPDISQPLQGNAEVLKKVELFLKELFARTALQSPIYENARQLQQDIQNALASFNTGKEQEVKP